jgi:hypothetical protein
MIDNLCYITIPSNPKGQRIGIVKLGEPGYYGVDFDHHNTAESAREHVRLLNDRLGIPKEIERSMRNGSMFGWNVPAAQTAIQFFTAQANSAKVPA